MRICLVTSEYPPGPMGGVGTYATIMPRLLTEAGHEVVLLAKFFDGAARQETVDGYEVHRLTTEYKWTGDKAKEDNELFDAEMRSLRSYVGVFAREVARKIAALHREKPFDIVISQDVEAPTWLAQDRRFVLGEMPELPFVVFVHSPHWQIQQYNEDSNYDRHEYHRYLYEKESMSLAEGLIVASRSMAKEVFRDIGPESSRVALIPLPSGDIPGRADFTKRLGSDGSGELRIVYSGRIELRKGVETLMEAAAPLMRENPRITLHLLGRDTDHPALSGTVGERLLRRYATPDIKDRIVLRGWMPREQIWSEYARATIGVVPSPWEPFSFACQEMMACGTCVVATKTGGMADMIASGKSGILCEPENADALRDALRDALNAAPESRKRLGESAAKAIREYCDNKRIVRDTAAFLTKIVERNRRERAKFKRVVAPGNLPFGDLPACRKHPAKQLPPVKKPGIVVPCYNLGEYLPECLDSLQKQTFGSAATYVVDDGSTDAKTLAALDEAAKRTNVKVLHYRNGGLPTARNRGAVAAMNDGCDALMFLDCDDWIETSYVEKAVGVLNRHPECGAVTAWTHTVGMMNTYWAPPHPQFPFLLAECMSTPPALVRTSAFRNVQGVHEELRYAYEDWEFWISLARENYVILTIPEPLIFYRMRPGSMARSYNFKTREHGRKAMMARHEDLYRRYVKDVVLLQDGFRYNYDGTYYNEFDALRKEREQLLIDIAWNQKEWRYYKGLLEEEKTRHAATKTELDKLRGPHQS
jgi:glycosyltransferase involved in cell wall biosynthesis